MDLASPTIHKSGNNYHVTHGADAELYVEFENHPVHQVAESEAQGRPIFKDVIYIKIMFPGDRTKQHHRPAKLVDDTSGPSDMVRFPRQWQAFQSQTEQTFEGTPLEEWPLLTKSQVLEMKGMHVHTVDALAKLSDLAIQNLGLGATGLREKAKLWLSKANDGAEISRIVRENVELKESVELLHRQVAELVVHLDDKPKTKAKAA